MAIRFPRGSEWRRWDLHFHTPSSFDYHDKSVSDEEIIQTLRTNRLAAVAVTDHHVIDPTRIRNLQRLAGRDLTVFPGIELRSELGGSESVHFNGIFADDCELDKLWAIIMGQLGLTPEQVRDKGDQNVYADFKQAATLFHELGGIVTIHAGSKNNTIENITNAISHKIALKHDIVEHVDFFEMGKLEDCVAYEEKVIPNLKRRIPMILCSDNHNARKYAVKDWCWLKADPTFPGLRRLIVEPQDRVFIGELPSKLGDIGANPSRYLSTISLNAVDSSTTPKWFENELPLNPGLVAIIGRKGSGKSALADALALAGRSHVGVDQYSFLNRNKFRKRGLAKQYQTSLQWGDGKLPPTNLDLEVDVSIEPERIRYLPQQFVETICNEAGVSESFQREIDKVVFDYIDESERLDAVNLGELIVKSTRAIDKRLATLRASLSDAIDRRIGFEKKRDPQYLQFLNNKLREKERELKALVDPPIVSKPKAEIDSATKKVITTIEAELAQLDQDIVKAEGELKQTTEKLTAYTNLSTSVQNLTAEVDELKKQLRSDCELLGVTADDLITLSVDSKTLATIGRALQLSKKTLQDKLGAAATSDHILTEHETNELPLRAFRPRRALLKKKLADIHAKLDEGNKAYQAYVKQKATIEAKRKQIQGDVSQPSMETILGLNHEIAYVGTELPKDIEALRIEVRSLCTAIFDTIHEKVDAFKSIYRPLTEFVQSEQDQRKTKESTLTFDVGVTCDQRQFETHFLAQIDQSRDGTFQGKVEGSLRLRSLMQQNSFDSADGVAKFIEDIFDSLTHDRTSKQDKKVTLATQLLGGLDAKRKLYHFLFSLEWLDVKYKIVFNGKDLNRDEFSPGERGAILLIFYLLIDRENIPLVIDQPEENLDNESVYTLLVPYIARAKAQRQIIIVTHNPNIAVVCDAEQIVHASMDKSSNEIRYESGSIECPEMNQKLLDVLEGTRPAFGKRARSYSSVPTRK